MIMDEHNLQGIHPELKVYLAKEKPFFGPGPFRLLSLVGETGSMREACSEMELSYSKGWKIINGMEAQLGYKVMERKRGGSDYGQSSLTEEGIKLLEKYEAFFLESREQVQAIFHKHFPY